MTDPISEAIGEPASEAVAVEPSTSAIDGKPKPRQQPSLDLVLAREERNDLGNARRFIARHGADLIDVERIGALCWDGKRYAADLADSEWAKRAHDTTVSLYDEALALRDAGPWPPSEEEEKETDSQIKEKLQQKRERAWNSWVGKGKEFAQFCGNASRLQAMVSVARPYLKRSAADMDPDPWLFNCQNGVLDLRQRPETRGQMRLQPHNREFRITKISGVAFDPKATCPTFDKFLEDILPDEAVRLYVQRFFGYCLTGVTSEQTFTIFYGRGKNGKSTLVDVIRRVIGDYGVTVPVEQFLDVDRRNADAPNPTMARLIKARAAFVSEPSKSASLSEHLVKEVTGGEPIQIRNLHERPVEFLPEFKALMQTNHKPRIGGDDIGIWRRIVMIAFQTTIPENKRIPNFIERLSDELPGILNWMLDGLFQWHERGLDPPSEIQSFIEEYRRESDLIGEFLDAETHEIADGRVQASALYDAYTRWCAKNAIDPIKASPFGKKMRARVSKVVKSMGVIPYALG
ncbi:putative DNA primase/helicase [Azospirillaceae bacterium]